MAFFLVQAEVDFLGQLHHPNLVKLIGYCIEDDQRLLVYEFMTRGSLENHLFRSKYCICCPRFYLSIMCTNVISSLPVFLSLLNY